MKGSIKCLGRIIKLPEEMAPDKLVILPEQKDVDPYKYNFYVEVGPPYKNGERLTLTVAEFYSLLLIYPLF